MSIADSLKPSERHIDIARSAVSQLGALVPVERVRGTSPNFLRGILLRLANAHLARSPRHFRNTELPGGLRLSGSTADVIQRHIYVFGVWEPPLTQWVRSRLRPGDVFVDFGANIGYFTLVAARAVGPDGHVVAVECVPSILERLRRNIADNDLGNVTVVPAIAADEEGMAEVFVGPAVNEGTSGTRNVEGGRPAGLVRRVVAASVVPEDLWPRVRVIKIDVEGDELAVLRGLRPLLEQLPPGASVMVEVTPDRLLSRGETAASLFDYLVSLGFTASALENEYTAGFYTRQAHVAPVQLSQPPEDQTDVVFVKR